MDKTIQYLNLIQVNFSNYSWTFPNNDFMETVKVSSLFCPSFLKDITHRQNQKKNVLRKFEKA